MRPFYNTARGSLGDVKDGILEGMERKYVTPELGERMTSLCGRAMVANLRFLKSLRSDPED